MLVGGQFAGAADRAQPLELGDELLLGLPVVVVQPQPPQESDAIRFRDGEVVLVDRGQVRVVEVVRAEVGRDPRRVDDGLHVDVASSVDPAQVVLDHESRAAVVPGGAEHAQRTATPGHCS